MAHLDMPHPLLWGMSHPLTHQSIHQHLWGFSPFDLESIQLAGFKQCCLPQGTRWITLHLITQILCDGCSCRPATCGCGLVHLSAPTCLGTPSMSHSVVAHHWAPNRPYPIMCPSPREIYFFLYRDCHASSLPHPLWADYLSAVVNGMPNYSFGYLGSSKGWTLFCCPFPQCAHIGRCRCCCHCPCPYQTPPGGDTIWCGVVGHTPAMADGSGHHCGFGNTPTVVGFEPDDHTQPLGSLFCYGFQPDYILYVQFIPIESPFDFIICCYWLFLWYKFSYWSCLCFAASTERLAWMQQLSADRSCSIPLGSATLVFVVFVFRLSLHAASYLPFCYPHLGKKIFNDSCD